VRYTTNEGPAGDKDHSRTAMMGGGGMSESRWGLRGTEDIGGGNKVLFNLEQRVNAGSGAISGNSFQQSWVAFQSPTFGRIKLGRDYNAMFYLYTSTFVSYPYSPYFNAYKPEIGLSAGARSNELIAWTGTFGQITAHLEATLRGESVTANGLNSGGKSRGGYVRWSNGTWSAGGGYLERDFGGDGKKLKVAAAGGSYKSGPWYFTASYGQNKHNLGNCGADAQCTYDYAVLSSLWQGTANGGFGGPAFLMANKRQMISVGATYQLTPQLNIGGHYWFAKQSGDVADAKGKAHFVSMAADYALSKRTDIYAEVDYTKLKGDHLSLNGQNGQANGAKSRTGVSFGIRHRF
jgi:predicted porin